ncbi:cytochrome P450 [Tropicibacter naphthalenivorans]|uniref:Epi-isozizaene 5-monooxygenase/(E)-beta-farnesene synthase n=1 Tax=Tropicibacter naphthalenivorans TaxID=441103 RepID=A0A0P1GNS4_9RHOB|nr:cytochrome P450 [Tropicibacter naphthalenivorans]CUH76966.1 Epi-isozizaene 5-monooxygenase/(E)-beta-farnesene synthase [Tropicibacter naphthalenivorans]SMC61939.1 Cytochrome P450 [Tropicibacter naphthalenivorans]
MIPPKPAARPNRVSLLKYVKLFRADILSAQPARLYRAWMAEFKTPFFRSYLVNQPELVKTVLKDRPMDFPKSSRISEGLRPLLGDSVFLTNGAQWQRQRRIIDPAFEGGRLRETYPAMWQAAEAALKRLTERAGQDVEIEEITSHAAADVIFRTLFSIPIEDEVASAVFHEFRAYQRTQPILNIAAFVPLPRWMPRFFRKDTRAAAQRIRGLIAQLTADRMAQIKAGTAPDDLATKIMTTVDPETGETFSAEEMVDQVAIFFLAGHETSASALGWALYLMALYPDWQDRLATEAQLLQGENFGDVSKLRLSRDVFRETLRLYPPVPMMVRQTTCPEAFRDRKLPKSSQIVLSPWHLHRHERLWERPDEFDPTRWQTENGKQCGRDAYIPFSAGPRVCTGAGFAMVEGPLLLSLLLRDLKVERVKGRDPIPEAHLTVRARDGIWLRVTQRPAAI